MDDNKKSLIELNKRHNKVLKTEPSYDFYVAIHSFVKHVESNPVFIKSLTSNVKANTEANIPGKYSYLKQIYQGLEDINIKSNHDLGHARYAMIKDLNKIQKKELSENNTVWKKRELSRKLVGEIHDRLTNHFSKLSAKNNKNEQ